MTSYIKNASIEKYKLAFLRTGAMYRQAVYEKLSMSFEKQLTSWLFFFQQARYPVDKMC